MHINNKSPTNLLEANCVLGFQRLFDTLLRALGTPCWDSCQGRLLFTTFTVIPSIPILHILQIVKISLVLSCLGLVHQFYFPLCFPLLIYKSFLHYEVDMYNMVSTQSRSPGDHIVWTPGPPIFAFTNIVFFRHRICSLLPPLPIQMYFSS